MEVAGTMSNRNLFQSSLLRYLTTVFVCMAMLTSCLNEVSFSQDIWEYSPYRVKVWVSISPSLALSEDSEKEIHRLVAENAEIQFGPTWSVSVEITPDSLFGSVLYRLDELTVDQLLSRELILVVGKSDEAKQAFLRLNPPPAEVVDPSKPKEKRTKEQLEVLADLASRAASLQSVRTLEGAVEKMKTIAIQPLQYTSLQREVTPFLDKKQWANFKEVVKPFDGGIAEMQRQLTNGEMLAALVQKVDLDQFKKMTRQISARLPWQPEALLRDNDKVFLASVDRVGESIRIQVKEMDSFVRRMGDIAMAEIIHKHEIPRTIAELAKEAFSPMVRIEETDNKTAVLRVRAAGLLIKEGYPVGVEPGDLLLPIIRRDDSFGNPTVLQSIPFTFLAVTEKIDNVSRLYGAIFTSSRGSLSNSKNRRTQRVALKLNPRQIDTCLKLGIQRSPGNAFVGAEIYRRTPGSDDLQSVGRTDWRGILDIGIKSLPTIQYDPPNESKVAAIADARKLSLSPVAPPQYKLIEAESSATTKISANAESLSRVKDSNGPSSESREAQREKEALTPPELSPASPKKPKGFIQLKLPLYLYYVKNGETLLARLPIVNGAKSMEQADLPDDRRRLETEAFLKGIQGEILDLVIRRKILESRIKQELGKKNMEKAEKLLDELKQVKSFEKVAEQLDSIQRRALSVERGPLLSGVAKRIDTMLDTTRQLMQKYLQDTLVRTLENELGAAK